MPVFRTQDLKNPFHPPRTEIVARKSSVESYRNLILVLAQKITNSTEEAKAAASEIFTDIQRYAVEPKHTQPAEKIVAGKVAFRRLVKFANDH